MCAFSCRQKGLDNVTGEQSNRTRESSKRIGRHPETSVLFSGTIVVRVFRLVVVGPAGDVVYVVVHVVVLVLVSICDYRSCICARR